MKATILMLALAAGTAFGAGDTLLHPAVSRAVEALTDPSGPGAAVLVVKNGATVHRAGHGLADLEKHLPITPDTLFDLASVSKQFTAAAVLLLQQQGRLSVQDPLSEYLHLFRPESWSRRIEIRDLLRHTSGLPDYSGDAWHGSDRQLAVMTLDEHTQWVVQQGPEEPPAETFEYNNGGYALLASIVESASGQSYGDFLEEAIFRPAGMPGAAVRTSRHQVIPGAAQGYRRGLFGPVRSSFPTAIHGDGNIYCSIRHLENWDRVLREASILSRASLQAAWTEHRTPAGERTGYGYGWEIEHYGRGTCVYHTGGWDGTSTLITRYLEESLTIVILSNDEDFDVERLERSIYRSLRSTQEPVEKYTLDGTGRSSA